MMNNFDQYMNYVHKYSLCAHLHVEFTVKNGTGYGM